MATEHVCLRCCTSQNDEARRSEGVPYDEEIPSGDEDMASSSRWVPSPWRVSYAGSMATEHARLRRSTRQNGDAHRGEEVHSDKEIPSGDEAAASSPRCDNHSNEVSHMTQAESDNNRLDAYLKQLAEIIGLERGVNDTNMKQDVGISFLDILQVLETVRKYTWNGLRTEQRAAGIRNYISDIIIEQFNGKDWSWNNLNTLSWSIGSTSGSIGEEQALDMLQADLGSSSVNQQEQIESYIYKTFKRASINPMFTLRRRLFHNIHILPPARRQSSGDCSYHASAALIESHLKKWYASLRKPKEFSVRLSHEHLKQMVLAYLKSLEGTGIKPMNKLEACLFMAQTSGIVSEDDYNNGRLAEAPRYRIKSYEKVRSDEKKYIPRYLGDGETVVTSFRVTEAYSDVLPHEIYRYKAPEKKTKDLPDAHCVVLTGHGDADPEIEEISKGESGIFYEYLNSYSPGWGVDGFGYIYADSLRMTYRIKV